MNDEEEEKKSVYFSIDITNREIEAHDFIADE